MSVEIFARRLRPFLSARFHQLQCPRTTRFLAVPSRSSARKSEKDITHDYEKRVNQLEAYAPVSKWYPRYQQTDGSRITQKSMFEAEHGHLQTGETAEATKVVLSGRVNSVRTAGSKLVFMDVEVGDSRSTIQAVVQLGHLQASGAAVSLEGFKAFSKVARKGDSYSIIGYAHRTARGELSILASEVPTMLSPSLHQIPQSLDDAETRARRPHVDMLVNAEAIEALRIRHCIDNALNRFFSERNFTKVFTPLLGAGAGGAAARPFETEASELANEKLNLRIAPELWLKRLVVGGMDRIYEIGPAFRNEGVDATHNPEFNICESYQVYATLEDLINMTEDLVRELSKAVIEYRDQTEERQIALPEVQPDFSHFARVEFIPMLQERMNNTLPDLSSQGAAQDILRIFKASDIDIPSSPTLSRLLDALAAHYLEPLSHEKPTFITHHPACMSPLSKHCICPKTNQIVAARAELFINGREYANLYEEENSPFEQRRKFEEQLKQREVDAEAMELDESYLEALEWGLPPTGGFGCGVDRFVMLFSGRERMADVLPFGTLRNVVALGSGSRKR